jgi:hypothetical protein
VNIILLIKLVCLTEQYIILISSHLCLGIPSGFFPPRFPNKTLCAPHLYLIHSTRPANFIIIDLKTRISGEDYKSWSFSLYSHFHSRYLSPLGPNIFLSAIFSNTLWPCSSLIMTDRMPRPHTTTDKIIFQYILILILP